MYCPQCGEELLSKEEIDHADDEAAIIQIIYICSHCKDKWRGTYELIDFSKDGRAEDQEIRDVEATCPT